MSETLKTGVSKILENTADISLKARARKILTELNFKNKQKILDVGCGDGYYLHKLSLLNNKLNLTGIDYDARALESAKRNLKEIEVRLIKADLMKKIPFKNNTFDRVVMSEVTEHLPDDKKGLSEVYRVMKPGAIICLTVPNANYPFLWDPVNWILEHLFSTHIKSGFFAGIWNQHVRLYQPDQIKKVMKSVGFKVEKVEVNTFWSLPFNHYIINTGARILAKGVNSDFLTNGVKKFKEGQDRGVIPALYFGISEAVDSLNEIFKPKKIGVSIFVKAYK